MINIIFIGIAGIVIVKKGGLSYFLAKLSSKESSNFSSYYLGKKDLHDNLNETSDKIVFIGDSLTDRAEWSELLENDNIINRGIDSDTTFGVLNRIDGIIDITPQKVFLMIGINDIAEGISEDEIINNYDKILSEFKENSSETKVYIQELLPVVEKRVTNKKNSDILNLNLKIKDLAKSYDYTFIDMYNTFEDNNELNDKFTVDGLHLSYEGYQNWKNNIYKYID